MPQAFAGFVCGFALAILYAPLGAWILVSETGRSTALQEAPTSRTNFFALTMGLHFITTLLLTAVGMLLGLALIALDEDARQAIGTPNIAFTLFVVVLATALFVPLWFLHPARRYVVPCALIFAITFGWIMPWLAKAG